MSNHPITYLPFFSSPEFGTFFITIPVYFQGIYNHLFLLFCSNENYDVKLTICCLFTYSFFRLLYFFFTVKLIVSLKNYLVFTHIRVFLKTVNVSTLKFYCLIFFFRNLNNCTMTIRWGEMFYIFLFYFLLFHFALILIQNMKYFFILFFFFTGRFFLLAWSNKC